MKIISKQRDYYDSVQGVMYDSDIIYHRKESSVLIYWGNREYPKIEIIGFCGKLYPVYIFKVNNLEHYPADDRDKKYLNKNKLTGKIFKLKSSYGDNKYISLYDQNEIYSAMLYFGDIQKDTKEHVFLDKLKTLCNDIERLSLFEKYKTPIFHLARHKHHAHNDKITIAPTLSNYNLQSVVDPYTAYQELVMWIGNQAVSEYPPQIKDDIVLRDSKGFDNWSFKNKWSEKKQRRRNKK